MPNETIEEISSFMDEADSQAFSVDDNIGDQGQFTNEETNFEEGTQEPETYSAEQTVTADSGSDPVNKPKEQKSKVEYPAGTKIDRQGNLTLPTGERISAGSHRRLFDKNLEQAQNLAKAGELFKQVHQERVQLAQQAQQVHAQNQQLIQQLNAMKHAGSGYAEYGLTNEEAIDAFKLAKRIKENPDQTVQTLLALAKNAGYPLEELGRGVDHEAVTALIEEKLQPITQLQQREEQVRAQQANLVNQAKQFLVNNPDARIHSGEIAEMLQNNKNLSLESAQRNLKVIYQKMGFDYNKTLKQNIAERRGRLKQSAPKQQTRQVPNGRSNAGAAPKTNKAYEKMTMQEIVKEAMQENGYR